MWLSLLVRTVPFSAPRSRSPIWVRCLISPSSPIRMALPLSPAPRPPRPPNPSLPFLPPPLLPLLLLRSHRPIRTRPRLRSCARRVRLRGSAHSLDSSPFATPHHLPPPSLPSFLSCSCSSLPSLASRSFIPLRTSSSSPSLSVHQYQHQKSPPLHFLWVTFPGYHKITIVSDSSKNSFVLATLNSGSRHVYWCYCRSCHWWSRCRCVCPLLFYSSSM